MTFQVNGRNRTIKRGQTITFIHPAYGRVRAKVNGINPRGTNGNGVLVGRQTSKTGVRLAPGTSVSFSRAEVARAARARR